VKERSRGLPATKGGFDKAIRRKEISSQKPLRVFSGIRGTQATISPENRNGITEQNKGRKGKIKPGEYHNDDPPQTSSLTGNNKPEPIGEFA